VRWEWAGAEMGIDIGAWCLRIGDTWTAWMGWERRGRVGCAWRASAPDGDILGRVVVVEPGGSGGGASSAGRVGGNEHVFCFGFLVRNLFGFCSGFQDDLTIG
jgi:hypothetical protein